MHPHQESSPFEGALVTLAGWLLTACVAWALLIAVAAVLEAATRGRLSVTSWVGCPPSMRRALLAGLGLALVTAPAQAAGAGRATRHVGLGVGSVRPQPPLPVPARPLGRTPPASGPIVVMPGDTLWGLSRARLPAGAPAAVVAEVVERLHRRNQGVIGPDPDLIRPGQRLVPPPRLRPVGTRPRQTQLEENR